MLLRSAIRLLVDSDCIGNEPRSPVLEVKSHAFEAFNGLSVFGVLVLLLLLLLLPCGSSTLKENGSALNLSDVALGGLLGYDSFVREFVEPDRFSIGDDWVDVGVLLVWLLMDRVVLAIVECWCCCCLSLCRRRMMPDVEFVDASNGDERESYRFSAGLEDVERDDLPDSRCIDG